MSYKKPLGFLRFMMKLMRRTSLISKHSWESFYYVTRDSAFVIQPRVKGRYEIEDQMPEISAIRNDVLGPATPEEIETVGGIFMEYMRKRGFRL